MPHRSKSPVTDAQSASELLTTDEVIDRLLDDAQLRRAAATCVLPAVRFGSTWRFRRSDLDEWIRKQKSQGVAAN